VRPPALALRLLVMPSSIFTVPDDWEAANSDFGPLAESGRTDERERGGQGVAGNVLR